MINIGWDVFWNLAKTQGFWLGMVFAFVVSLGLGYLFWQVGQEANRGTIQLLREQLSVCEGGAQSPFGEVVDFVEQPKLAGRGKANQKVDLKYGSNPVKIEVEHQSDRFSVNFVYDVLVKSESKSYERGCCGVVIQLLNEDGDQVAEDLPLLRGNAFRAVDDEPARYRVSADAVFLGLDPGIYSIHVSDYAVFEREWRDFSLSVQRHRTQM